MRKLILLIIIFISAINFATAQDINFNDSVSIHLNINAKQLSRDSAIKYAKANFKDTLVLLTKLKNVSDDKFYLIKDNILMKIFLNSMSKKKGIAGEMKSNMDILDKLYPLPFSYIHIYKNGVDSVLVRHSKIADYEFYDFLYFMNNSNKYIVAYLYFHPSQKKYADRLLKEIANGVLIYNKVLFDGY